MTEIKAQNQKTKIKKKKKVSKRGLAPGSPIFTGSKKSDQVRFDLLAYNKSEVKHIKEPDLNFIKNARSLEGVNWLVISGLHETKKLEKILASLGISNLTLEDILNVNQRPKTDPFPNYIFSTMRVFSVDSSSTHFESDQVSCLLVENFVITILEKETDIFLPLVTRINNPAGRIRNLGPDYLYYAVLDILLDSYFNINDTLEEIFEDYEEKIILESKDISVANIHAYRKMLLRYLHAVRPIKDVIQKISKSETSLITESIHPYLNDLADHYQLIADSAESLREMSSGLMDTHLSLASNKMNEVMKVLTIIATIFIPLSFFAGLYGMNFENMPELKWEYGYFILLGLMFIATALMLWYFRKKDWL